MHARIIRLPVNIKIEILAVVCLAVADGLVEGTGHFHVLVDEKAPAEGDAIPFDDT
jgi:hypothetical protein